MVELLVVLALIAMLSSMTIPRLFGVLGRSQLQKAAQQLAADLGEARLLAINHGCSYQLRFETDGTRYWIGPQYESQLDPLTDESHSNGLISQSDSSLSKMPQPAVTPRIRHRSNAEALVDELTDGIQFGNGAATLEYGAASDSDITTRRTRLAAAVPNTTMLPKAVRDDEQPATDEELQSVASNWTDSVVFFPDGRAKTQSVTMTASDGRCVNVTVRGITGAVTTGSITRPTSE